MRCFALAKFYFELVTLMCKAKKNKSYVSKLPRAFVFRCAFDSAKFKVLIFFACLIFFFQFFMNLLVKIYKKRYERHNETLWTTDFFNSVFCLVSCSSKNQVPYFKAVTDSNLTCLLLKKKKKTHTFRSGFPICHEFWDIAFIFLAWTSSHLQCGHVVILHRTSTPALGWHLFYLHTYIFNELRIAHTFQPCST